MQQYCFLCSVTSADTRLNLRALATAVRGYALARRFSETPAGDPPDFFVLAVSGTPVTLPRTVFQNGLPVVIQEEITLHYLIGYNQNVTQPVANELAVLQTSAGRQIAFNPPLARAQIVTRLHALAGEDGCDAVWDVKPGDDITTGITTAALLLARFTSPN